MMINQNKRLIPDSFSVNTDGMKNQTEIGLSDLQREMRVGVGGAIRGSLVLKDNSDLKQLRIDITSMPRLSVEDILKEFHKTGIIFRPIIESPEISHYQRLMEFRDLTEEENKIYQSLK
jgi:hypothetical protein